MQTSNRWWSRRRRGASKKKDSAPSVRGATPTAGEVRWWDFESTPEYEKYMVEAYRAGRDFVEPDRPGTPAPACFDRAVAWVTEMGASRVQAFHADHRSDVAFVVENRHLMNYHGELNHDLVAVGGYEAAQRRAARDKSTAGSVRAKVANYRSDEAALDFELSRLRDAECRLAAAMKEEFVRGWRGRDDIELVAFPQLDPSSWRYAGHSGIALGEVFGDPDLGVSRPESLLPPELENERGDGPRSLGVAPNHDDEEGERA